MAVKRDALPPFSDSVLAKEPSTLVRVDSFAVQLGVPLRPVQHRTAGNSARARWHPSSRCSVPLAKAPINGRCRRAGEAASADALAGREVTDRAPVQST